MTIEKNNAQGVSDSSELQLKFILENKLTLKEIGAFVTVYDMYLNGEMPITVGGICQHTSDGAVTVRKYIKRLIDKGIDLKRIKELVEANAKNNRANSPSLL